MNRFSRGMGLGVLAAFLAAAPAWPPVAAWAQTMQRPAPLLTADDRAVYMSAFGLGAAGDWDSAAATASAARDKTLAKVIDWYRFQQKDTAASFDEIAQFLDGNPGWPRRAVLQTRAEAAIAGVDPARLVAFFKRNPPVSGAGELRYGMALISTGDRAAGTAMLRRGWVGADVDPASELNIVQAYGPYLTPADHAARLNRLLVARDAGGARRMLALVAPDQRAMGQAALAYYGRTVRSNAALSPARPQDAGLWFAEIDYLRAADRDDEAAALIARLPDAATQVEPDRWWPHLRYAARRLINDGNPADAFRVVTAHSMVNGTNFLDAEWMAGWIALRFLNRPDQAAPHFQAMLTQAAAPISVARGHYWLGRALAAQNQPSKAAHEYAIAAQYPQTYYGQLAAYSLGEQAARPLPADPGVGTADARAAEALEMSRVARMLIEIGEINRVRPFLGQAMANAKTPGQRAWIADMAATTGGTSLGVIAAKEASSQGTTLIARAYPVMAMPRGGMVEAAFALAIARQESEFRPDAVSPAGARGLMQLMPGTARLVAASLGLPFSADRLTDDPDYNAQLGVAHLDELVADFGGSYIMTAGAYNAGTGRIDRWVDAYGDPRSTGVDVIDWVELIPFEETRNYVMRVIENTQVYRQRLSPGARAPLGIAADLIRGGARRSPYLETAGRATAG